MAEIKVIPDVVIGRLPVYLRALVRLLEGGQASASSRPRIVASQDLARLLGIGSAQIRKDLAHFGEFGKQGLGYDIVYLRDQLQRVLNVDREWDVVLVGAGDLGHAIAHYGGFEGRGFRVTRVFDHNPQKIGRRLGRFQIDDAARLVDEVREMGIQIAIVAVPASAAQAVVDKLVQAGVRAILNYAPITVSVPPGVRVQHIDPVIHLQHMTYYLPTV